MVLVLKESKVFKEQLVLLVHKVIKEPKVPKVLLEL